MGYPITGSQNPGPTQPNQTKPNQTKLNQTKPDFKKLFKAKFVFTFYTRFIKGWWLKKGQNRSFWMTHFWAFKWFGLYSVYLCCLLRFTFFKISFERTNQMQFVH